MASSSVTVVDTKEKPEVKSFKDGLSKQAEVLVVEVFPKKILEINEALESDLFNVSDMSTIHCDLNLPQPILASSICNGPAHQVQHEEQEQPLSKKRKFNSDVDVPIGTSIKQTPQFREPVPNNPKVVEVMDFVKPQIIQVVDRCNLLKIWIQLMIPKIEDGNNFGVSIQEDILSEVSKAEADAGTYLEQTTRYFGARGKLLSKAAKYPCLEDYQRAIHEYDEKVFFSFKLILRELRNIYAVLYDVIIKNYEKLIQPRSSNTSSMY